ncbi:MAG TPA: ATP-binding protein, partial [Pyrinomonadaceae bacterium]|nr:ATP-binding protein [Pyrinomonadaceae bacterium]
NAVHWLLTKPARTISLRRLVESNRLNDLLNGPLPPTDPFGEVLRLLLRHGANLKLEFLDSEQLLNLIAAMEATSDSGVPQPDVNEVRRRLGRREFLSEYDVLLARGFVGRKDEMAKLYEFLSAGDQASHPASWTSLVLTGFGGSGKSTLLAKFAREVAKENLATVVILDFDRPGIDARDFYWMEQEISRQVGHQYPGSSEFLRSRRSEERRHRGEYRDSVRQSASDVEEESRSSRSIMFDVANALTNEGANGRPFLLIFDTYEQIEEQDLSVKIFDWLYEISSYLPNTPLRVIFSGRLYDNNLQLLQQQSQATIVDVAELDPDDAKQLLLQNGIPEPTAIRLVRAGVLPLRPLELTLLARITIDLDKTIDELEDEINKGGEAAKELFAGLVYRRVLRRLQDPTAQRLAYPGLVLRYVTADLIRYVLGPALDMPAFDEAGAKNAFEALASASWLVRRDGDRVWHRGDLRRSTLKAMMAAERDNAKRISDEAIKYFEEQTDVASQAEAVYHRLLWMDDPEEGNEFQLAELKRASDHIKANVGDLPPAAATLLKFAVEGKVPSAELECLPKIYIDSGYSSAGKDLVEHRLFGKALKLLDRRHQEGPVQPAAILEDWEVDTLFSTAAWDRLIFFEPEIKKQPREALLFAITRALYPLQIVSPELLQNFPLGDLLEAATDNERYLQ